jgi:hypothetical protein
MQTQTAAAARRIAETHREQLLRLAAQGERNGVTILVDPRTGQHVATSASDPTRCYHVSAAGCTCKGFAHWGRCQHHSLLLAELGAVADADGAGEPPAAVDCGSCRGRGWEYAESDGYSPPWQVACHVCSGLGFEVPGDDHHADDGRHSAPYDLGRALVAVRPAA